ncbi:MAG: TVP38/TMEM64 family protein [Myxococcota bacterium]
MSKKNWIAWGVIGAVLLLGYAIRQALDVEWSAESIRALIDEAGIWAPLAFIALVGFRLFVLIPSQLLLTGAGLLFGAALGTLYGAIGLTLSAIVNYAIVHGVGAGAIRDRIPPRYVGALALARSKAGAGAVALATGYPVGPISGVQLAAALSGMGFFTYSAAVGLGSAIRAATFAYFGSTLFEGGQVAVGLGVLAAALICPWLYPPSRAWLRQAMARPEDS